MLIQFLQTSQKGCCVKIVRLSCLAVQKWLYVVGICYSYGPICKMMSHFCNLMSNDGAWCRTFLRVPPIIGRNNRRKLVYSRYYTVAGINKLLFIHV